jgi:hypothetical protein
VGAPLAFAIVLLVLTARPAAGADPRAQPESFGELASRADAIVVGRILATSLEAGVAGCVTPLASVALEEALTGTVAPSAGTTISVEFASRCGRDAGTLPYLAGERAVLAVLNRGYELQRTQPGTNGADVERAATTWRTLGDLPVVVDRRGVVELLDRRTETFLDEYDGTSFASLVAGIRELDYMAPSPPSTLREAVPVSWWFGLEAIALGGLVGLLSGGPLIVAIVKRGRARRVALVAFGLCVLGVGAIAVLPSPRLLRDLDFNLNQTRREAVVKAIQDGTLTETDEYGSVLLPAALADLSENGRVDVRRGSGDMVFFTRVVGFSPDPYCGYEYISDPDLLEVDPLGSGHGIAEALGGDWYWICAS